MWPVQFLLPVLTTDITSFNILLFLQEPSVSSPSVPASLASTSSFPVTRGTCTACPMISATATAGPCSAPGEASASHLSLASSALSRPLFNQYRGLPVPNLDRRTAPCAKAGCVRQASWTHRQTKQTSYSMFPCVSSYPLYPGYRFCVCVCLKWVSWYLENTRKKPEELKKYQKLKVVFIFILWSRCRNGSWPGKTWKKWYGDHERLNCNEWVLYWSTVIVETLMD